jgi:hypothetical protein
MHVFYPRELTSRLMKMVFKMLAQVLEVFFDVLATRFLDSALSGK